jgi:hypothetical protein
LSDGRYASSHLVSAPIKLRRARITKFERYNTVPIRVRQGYVARLPCFGLPDVIPGPPEIWFEKQGQESVPLGRTGNEASGFLIKNFKLILEIHCYLYRDANHNHSTI